MAVATSLPNGRSGVQLRSHLLLVLLNRSLTSRGPGSSRVAPVQRLQVSPPACLVSWTSYRWFVGLGMACCSRQSQESLTGLADAAPIVGAWRREVQRLRVSRLWWRAPMATCSAANWKHCLLPGFVSGRRVCLDSARWSRGCVRTGGAFGPVCSSPRPRSVRADPPPEGTSRCCVRSRKSTCCAGRLDHSADARWPNPASSVWPSANGGRPRPMTTVRIGQAAVGRMAPSSCWWGCCWPGRSAAAHQQRPGGRSVLMGASRTDRRLPG
jgi:hypothetical protein